MNKPSPKKEITKYSKSFVFSTVFIRDTVEDMLPDLRKFVYGTTSVRKIMKLLVGQPKSGGKGE